MARHRCAQHPNSRVWFDGTYGAPGLKRQRFKCVQTNGARHVFTLPLPRLLAGDEYGHECLDCERIAPKHEGPQLARRFQLTTREVAAALADVGRGLSYRAAGRNVRLRGQNPLLANANREANLVADWVEVFAPVVFAEHAPTEWPDVIVIDEVPFSKLTGTKKGKPIYAILAATGYFSGKPRLLRLEAFPSASKVAWVNFFCRSRRCAEEDRLRSVERDPGGDPDRLAEAADAGDHALPLPPQGAGEAADPGEDDQPP